MERITQKNDFPTMEPMPVCSVDTCGNDGMHKIVGQWFCNFHATSVFQVKHESFEDFMEQARELVMDRAKEKGYNDKGEDKNELMSFTNQFFPGHPYGEVLYKLIRYQRKKNKEDLLKAAAWIYLIWKNDQ